MTRQEAMEISKMANARFDKTRDIQWKFNIAAWSLIVAGIYFFSKDTSFKIPICWIWIISIVFFLAHWLFIYRTQISLVSSKAVEDYIYEQLSSDNDPNLKIIINIKKISQNIVGIGARGIYWLIFQLITTGVLLSIFVLAAIKK